MTQHEYSLREFNEWVRLAKFNPAAFESRRQAVIQRFIEQAPEERRHRLRCLQWRIEQERARAKTPLGACIRISRMMWDQVTCRGGLRDRLEQLRDALEQGSAPPPPPEGRIIPFPRRPD